MWLTKKYILMSFPRKWESRIPHQYWIPAFAGITIYPILLLFGQPQKAINPIFPLFQRGIKGVLEGNILLNIYVS